MISQEQVMPGAAGGSGDADLRAVRRVRNFWLAFVAFAFALTLVFAVASLQGLQKAPEVPTGPQVGWESQDQTQRLDARDYLRSTEMLSKWILAEVAVVLGAIEISLALSLYLRTLRRSGAAPLPGKRIVPNILRTADRRYIHDHLPQEVATAYMLLSGLALGSAVIAGFLILDSTTWILAAIISGNW
ncbi:hypothetical protein BI364_15580 [Acidihalobacter yilgarnensis]|uniref:Uncharacterized protein n=1 Tax=Acidihalobacter yilgarnensis TaxID=2819280 RepID=A0A1D8IS44_9GAMM|nr:hypothetical protein [Acidihalobacter yilgarnensis]AOU99164.1 hypothetical protein BI364_15580 [Acidihalobacter yilgarnensis]